MARILFGDTEEEVVTRDEFSLDKARQVLSNEVVAVLGYGVQGPAQSLNLRDNGINAVVGQNEGNRNWQRAVQDGWVPERRYFRWQKQPLAAQLSNIWYQMPAR